MNRVLLCFYVCTFSMIITAQKTKITIKKMQNDNDSITIIEKEMSAEDEDVQLWMDSIFGEAPIFLKSFDFNDYNMSFDGLLDSIFSHTDEINDFFNTFSESSTYTMSSKGFLGVYFEDEESSDSISSDGITITNVIPKSAAEEAGLLIGDIVVQIDDISVNIISDATNFIGSKNAGDRIKIVYLRDNRPSETFATLKSRGDFSEIAPEISIFDKMPFYANKRGFAMESETPKLGLQLQDIDAEAIEDLKVKSKQGVLVVQVLSNSSAQKMGFKMNDVITSFNGLKVHNAEDLKDRISKIDTNNPLIFDIVRYGKSKKLTGKISK